MNWVLTSLITVTCVHVAAIVLGRSSGSLPHKIAFFSGILGLLSIPVLMIAGLKSLCIAGGCGDGASPADIAGVAFIAIALCSLISLLFVWVRRKRA